MKRTIPVPVQGVSLGNFQAPCGSPEHERWRHSLTFSLSEKPPVVFGGMKAQTHKALRMTQSHMGWEQEVVAGPGLLLKKLLDLPP